MSFGKTFGIRAAMEELDEAAAAEATPPVENEEVVEMPADEETVDAAMAETAEAAAEVDGGGEAVETAVGDAETLADVADKMEATEETGGMTEQAAAIAEVAIEALRERLCIRRAKALPAMESFGSESSRMKATSIAVESIREELKKVWQAIVAMLKKVYEAIKGFMKSIFDTNTKLKEKAEKLLKAVDSVEGKPEATEFEAPKVAGVLCLGGKVSSEGVVKGLKELSGDLEKTAGIFNSLGDFIPAAQIEGIIKNKESFDALELQFNKPEGMEAVEDDRYGKAPEKMAVFVSGEMLGNTVIKAVVPAAEAKGQESFDLAAKTSISVEKFDTKQKEVTAVPTLDAAEMRAVLGGVVEATKAMEDFKPAVEKADDLMSKTIQAALKATAMNIAEDKDIMARGRSVQKALSKVGVMLTRPSALTARVLVAASKASLDLVVKSAAQYKGAKMDALPAPKEGEGEPAAA